MPMRRPQAQRTPQGTSPTATRPWAYQAHCHSPPGRADRAGRTATRALGVPPALPLAPWAFRPARSPPSGSVNHTSTRPWAYQAHCHSPLGRAESVRSIPSGSVRRTATRPLGAPTAPIALPLAPERTVRTAKRPEPLSYRPWVRFWQAIDVFRVIPHSHHAMGPIESALVSLAAGTPGKGLGDPSSFESIHP